MSPQALTKTRKAQTFSFQLPTTAVEDRLFLSKVKSTLFRAQGVESVTIFRDHVMVTLSRSLKNKTAIRNRLKALTAPAPESVGAEKSKKLVTINFFHLDEHPKTSLGFSMATLLLTLYGNVPFLALNAILIVLSLPIYARAFEAMVKEKKLSVDFLDALAHITAQLQRNYAAVAFMSMILSVGNMLRHKTKAKAKEVINDILAFEKHEMWVERGGKKVKLPVAEMKEGDNVIVCAGEVIPVDGEVVSGTSSIDQKSLTGESLPIVKTEGEKVYAGTLVIDGILKIHAERVGNKTSVAEIVKIVTEGAEAQTDIEDYARKFGDNLVLPILGVSGAVSLLTADLNRFTSMIIVDYGTGMRVSAPTAFLSQMIQAARSGILIKGGKSLERMKKADVVVFDKTGTLTIGKPMIHDAVSFDKHLSPQELFRLAAAAECKFSHPVALAIIKKAEEEGIYIPSSYEAKYHIGHGVESRIEGKKVMLGSEKLMRDRHIDLSAANKKSASFYDLGQSVLFLSVNGKLAGIFSYSDILRPEAKDVVKALRSYGIKQVVMMTGDNARVARTMGKQAGVDHVVSEALPAMKVDYIKKLQQKGHVVVAVGDGINDSPALTVADVGITVMNGVELAKQASDVVLLEENLWKVVETFQFSANTMGIIKTNRKILYLINAGVFTAAAFGTLSPTLSSAISDGASVLATLNSIKPVMQKKTAEEEWRVKVKPIPGMASLPENLPLVPA